MNISIFGLGYVGAVSLACLARDGHRVVGVDIEPAKLNLIREGKTPVVEEGMVDLMRQVVSDGLVSVTDNVRDAIATTELSLICVGTPSAANGSQDQSAVLRLAKELGAALKLKTESHVFVFRSTLVPGTVEDVLTPIIRDESGKVEGRDFHVCFQPEFLREGSSIKDYDKPPFTVVGTRSVQAAEAIKKIFGHLPAEFHVTSVRAAEMVKYCCNNFHALKITFANETARLCEALSVDPFEVMSMVCKDRQLNISSAYLRPGFAFGGSCLPKDLRATLYLAKNRDVQLPMHAGVLQSNRVHVERAIEKVLAYGRRRIALIGLSFKSGTDDLRESPLVTLAEHLIGKGMTLKIFDPDVQLSKLLGANRQFIEQHVPHIGDLLCPDIGDVIASSEVLVVGTTDRKIHAAIKQHANAGHYVLDLVNGTGAGGLGIAASGLAW